MTNEEMDQFLESIGGLENGYFSDRPKIKSNGFLEISNGWFGLVKELIEDCIALGWDKQICQIKEKFGGLRFYYQGGDDEISGMVRMAEAWADHSCETCKGPLTTDCTFCVPTVTSHR